MEPWHSNWEVNKIIQAPTKETYPKILPATAFLSPGDISPRDGRECRIQKQASLKRILQLPTCSLQITSSTVLSHHGWCYSMCAHYIREQQRSTGWSVQICTFQELITMPVSLISPMQFIHIQGVSKRALQLWKLIEIYTEDIHNVLNCQNVAKHTEFYLG